MSIAADAYVKSLKSQRNLALDALAERDAELAQAKADLELTKMALENLKKDVPNPTAD